MCTQYVRSLECGHLFKANRKRANFIISGSFDGTIKVWELPKGVCLFTINAHSDWIMCFEQLINGYLITYKN